MSPAWKRYGVGGKDVRGNDIVVAVIDNGFDLGHIDLSDNWFVNGFEIPGNGIDDDRNGYVDDYLGHSIGEKDPDSPSLSGGHGNHSAGIIGAVADNGIGVAGLNWKVKIIPIEVPYWNLKTSHVIEAYSYVLAMKKRWLETYGKKGANIVATNFSLGFNFADCTDEDYRVWNDLYDEMGALGILSVVATMNVPKNVDEEGDVPSSCSSEFIVAVTNTMVSGGKNPDAGYGKTSIDLGAPGTDILSTVFNHDYKEKTGTSSAAPHVAGAIAYLHSVASEVTQRALFHDRAATTLNFKKILMESARPHASLRQTVSGGSLDVFAAAALLKEYEKGGPLFFGP
ncbi:MAG: S8 family serine peptidase [Bacteriovoracales bacterium]|nr:S8 family serine peptidase [Bacteriovoracales bacterium]